MKTFEKTSFTHPIRIDWVSVPYGGRIGMTFCPGKVQPAGWSGVWRRDLRTDLAAMQRWGCTTLISLMEGYEFNELFVNNLGDMARQCGMIWYHLPILDQHPPDGRFMAGWPTIWPHLRQQLQEGKDLVLHCKGGLGRTGTVAACLLVNFGDTPTAAIGKVRLARPGTVENGAQELFVYSWKRQRPNGK